MESDPPATLLTELQELDNSCTDIVFGANRISQHNRVVARDAIAKKGLTGAGKEVALVGPMFEVVLCTAAMFGRDQLRPGRFVRVHAESIGDRAKQNKSAVEESCCGHP